jgi:hypothetical protein
MSFRGASMAYETTFTMDQALLEIEHEFIEILITFPFVCTII